MNVTVPVHQSISVQNSLVNVRGPILSLPAQGGWQSHSMRMTQRMLTVKAKGRYKAPKPWLLHFVEHPADALTVRDFLIGFCCEAYSVSAAIHSMHRLWKVQRGPLQLVQDPA